MAAAATERLWHKWESSPEGVLVETKIDDIHGERNVQSLIRRGRLWFVSDEPNAMYVYYRPTHWRFLADVEVAA